MALTLAATVFVSAACGNDEEDELPRPPPGPSFAVRVLVEGETEVIRAASDLDIPERRYPHLQAVDRLRRDASSSFELVDAARVTLSINGDQRRHEADTNAQGLVIFQVPESEWPMGAVADITVYKDAFIIQSRLQMARPTNDEPVVVRLRRAWGGDIRTDDVRVAVDRPPVDFLQAGALEPYGISAVETSSDSVVIEIPRDSPVITVGFEETAVSNFQFDRNNLWITKTSTDTNPIEVVVDRDMVASTETMGSFGLPERSNSPLLLDSAQPLVEVVDAGSAFAGTIGFLNRLSRNAMIVDFDLDVVEGSVPGQSAFEYSISAADGSASFGFGEGRAEGTHVALLDVPEWTTTSTDAFRGTLSWNVFDDDVTTEIWVLTDDTVGERVEGLPRWIVEVPDGVTELRMPPLPVNASQEVGFGEEPRVFVSTQRSVDTPSGVELLVSWSRPFESAAPVPQ